MMIHVSFPTCAKEFEGGNKLDKHGKKKQKDIFLFMKNLSTLRSHPSRHKYLVSSIYLHGLKKKQRLLPYSEGFF
jgi:hypothetical protein